MTRLGLAVLAYLVPTFALGFVWHLVLFERYYQSLQIYRSDIIIPFGFLSMLIQGGIFGWICARAFASSQIARFRTAFSARFSPGASRRLPSRPRTSWSPCRAIC